MLVLVVLLLMCVLLNMNIFQLFAFAIQNSTTAAHYSVLCLAIVPLSTLHLVQGLQANREYIYISSVSSVEYGASAKSQLIRYSSYILSYGE